MIRVFKYILLIVFTLKFIALKGFENNLVAFIYIGFLMLYFFLEDINQKIEKTRELQ